MDKLTSLASYTLSKEYKFSDGTQPCYTMIDDILLYKGYSIGVAVMIPLLNAILLIILRGK